jgi:hypothetical protein
MISEKLNNFIKQDLYHELRCLLGAATIWEIDKKQEAGFNVVVSMDSALLHARNLFIFFAPTKNDEANSNTLKVTAFGVKKEYDSQRYSVWKEALNRHLFHLDVNRMKPTNLKNSGHLNEQVIVFAQEILNLWKKFENDPDAIEFRDTLIAVRKRAIADAKNDTRNQIDPLFKFV